MNDDFGLNKKKLSRRDFVQVCCRCRRYHAMKCLIDDLYTRHSWWTSRILLVMALLEYPHDRIYSSWWNIQYKQDWLKEYLPKISDCLTDNIGCADRLYIKDEIILRKVANDIASVFGNAVSRAKCEKDKGNFKASASRSFGRELKREKNGAIKTDEHAILLTSNIILVLVVTIDLTGNGKREISTSCCKCTRWSTHWWIPQRVKTIKVKSTSINIIGSLSEPMMVNSTIITASGSRSCQITGNFSFLHYSRPFGL